MTTVNGWLPSASVSSTPVTVTVCGAFQLSGVKVSAAGATVPSVVSLLDRPMVTLDVGRELSTSRKLAVPPASVVVGGLGRRHGHAGGLVVGVGQRHLHQRQRRVLGVSAGGRPDA